MLYHNPAVVLDITLVLRHTLLEIGSLPDVKTTSLYVCTGPFMSKFTSFHISFFLLASSHPFAF